ncbi:LuxR C-terminal-related transcriptional regulator [Actinoplanes sp. NPDC023714]|uniref:helix-turn-helix transcriptional regulator n=1 Tax=Actinoplanes sp. NPDC023714 TaxID=3154322 RepID=UPI0033E243C7
MTAVRTVALRSIPQNTVDEAGYVISGVFRRVWPQLRRCCLTGRSLDEPTRAELKSAARRLAEMGLPRSAMIDLTRAVVAMTERQVASVERNLDAVRALRMSKYSLMVVHDVIASLLEPGAGADESRVAGDEDDVSRLEREILRRLAYGQSSSEIADELHYSKQAVSYHLSRLLSKYRVPNRTALVATAYENGLLPIRIGSGLQAG